MRDPVLVRDIKARLSQKYALPDIEFHNTLPRLHSPPRPPPDRTKRSIGWDAMPIKNSSESRCCFLEATPRFELGIKVLQTSALPLGYVAIGAADEIRTRDPRLGKAMLYP